MDKILKNENASLHIEGFSFLAKLSKVKNYLTNIFFRYLVKGSLASPSEFTCRRKMKTVRPLAPDRQTGLTIYLAPTTSHRRACLLGSLAPDPDLEC